MKTILVDAIHTFVSSKGKIFIEMQKLLDTFSNPKILLSNTNKEKQKELGLHTTPYPFFSLETNPRKTNPLYYTTMLEYFHLQAHDAIYFEHNKDAVKSAVSVGIKTYFYNQYEKDLIALKKFLEENV